MHEVLNYAAENDQPFDSLDQGLNCCTTDARIGTWVGSIHRLGWVKKFGPMHISEVHR